MSCQVLPFEVNALYPNYSDLSHLQLPFTKFEVHSAVANLAKNKSPDPDDLPNEFLQCYWEELKGEIMGLVQNFYDNMLDLREANWANIILIPKKKSSSQVSDY